MGRNDKPMTVEELAAYAKKSDRWTHPKLVLGPLMIVVGVVCWVVFASLVWQRSSNSLAMKVTAAVGSGLIVNGIVLLVTGRTLER